MSAHLNYPATLNSFRSCLKVIDTFRDGVDGGHGASAAGRLYCTSLARLMLKVYYRHLPIYGKGSIDEDFKE